MPLTKHFDDSSTGIKTTTKITEPTVTSSRGAAKRSRAPPVPNDITDLVSVAVNKLEMNIQMQRVGPITVRNRENERATVVVDCSIDYLVVADIVSNCLRSAIHIPSGEGYC
jgi:hypothetical protein